MTSCPEARPAGVVVDGQDAPAAARLAAELGLPRVADRAHVPAGGWWVGWRDGRLELGSTAAGGPRSGLSVEFLAGPLGRRLVAGPGARDPLARALGRPVSGRRLLDATAGLGRDAMLAARLGHEVLAVERSPILVALLADGLRRAAREVRLAPVVARVELRQGDARELLLDGAFDPATVFLDPMFPARTKTAKVRKPMQLLQQLLAAPDADDGSALLGAALSRPGRRVVVKRPARAPPLAAPGQAPMTSVRGGRTTRYDVYLS